MTLIERSDALTVLNRLVGARGRSCGHLVAVRATVGGGRTELLHTFANGLDGEVLLLFATGSQAERGIEYGVLGQLLRHPALPAEAADHVDHLMGDLDPPALPRPAGTSIARCHVRALDALCFLLMAEAATRPVVVMVDDAHVADAASLDALGYMQRRFRFSTIVMVVSEPIRPAPDRNDFHAELDRRPQTTHLTLAPLTRGGIGELMAARLGRAPDPDTAAGFHAICGGNPMLAVSLLEDQVPAAVAEQGCADIVVDREFTYGLLAHLRRLGPDLLTVAQCVALLDDGETETAATMPALVDAMLGIGTEAADRALGELEAAGVLRDGRFRHPVALETVVRSIPASHLSGLRKRAASVLYLGGRALCVVADALTAADRAEEPWAIQVLRSAAEQDALADRGDLAVRRLELCVRDTTCAAVRAEATLHLLRVEWRHNPAAATRHIEPLLRARDDGYLTGEDAAQLANFLIWYGQVDEVIAGSDAADGDRAPRWPVGSQAWLSFLSPPIDATPEDRPAGPGAGGRVSSMLHRIRSGASPDTMASSAARTLNNPRLGDETLTEHLAALTALMHADRVERATDHCDALLAVADARQVPTWQAILLGMRGELSRRSGDLADAADQAVAAIAALPSGGWGVAIGGPLATAVRATTGMGRHDEAAALLRTPIPDGVFQTQFGLQLLWARGKHQLAVGRPDAALDTFQRCGRLMVGWEVDIPSLVPWRTGAGEAHLMLGDRNAARALVTMQLEKPGGAGAHTRGGALRVLAATLPPRQRFPVLTESAQLLHESGDRVGLAYALRDLCLAHKLSNDASKARSVAVRAVELAQACRAEPLTHDPLLCDQANAPTAVAQAAEPADVLSDAERRVAVLAMQGFTNRQISGRLFITVSTVEQHLTRVYRKLNVSRRSDLGPRLPHATLEAS